MWRSSFFVNLEAFRIIATTFPVKRTSSQVFLDILSSPMLWLKPPHQNLRSPRTTPPACSKHLWETLHSMESPLYMFWSVKYTFTCHRCDFCKISGNLNIKKNHSWKKSLPFYCIKYDTLYLSASVICNRMKNKIYFKIFLDE